MNIFITGVAGFLGSHLADRMLALGHVVSGNDSLIGGHIHNIPKDITFFNIDCCDFKSMSNIMKNIDIVIHTAATAHEGLSVFSPSFITRNIFEASISTISAAISCKVKRFLFCSSMARYGGQVPPFVEEMLSSPVDPYGIAKEAVEKTLRLLANTHGMEWNIAVPHNIIGPRQKYDDPFRNVMSIMINRNLQGKPAIVYGDGSQTRCFSYVDDCISCLEKMALDHDIKNQLINIGPDEGVVTIKTLADMVAEECGFTGDIEYMPDRPQEVKYAYCSSDKARELLGYKTTIDLATAIKHTADYIRASGPRPFDYSYPLEIINDLTPKTWSDRLI